MPGQEPEAPPNVTIGEVYRLILTLKTDIEKKPSDEAVKHLRERITELESWQTWAMRLGIPGLIAIVFNLLDSFEGKL